MDTTCCARRPAGAAAHPRAPATRHYRGILRFPVVRQLIRFTGVGIICTATSLALYALLRPWLGPQLANAAALIMTSLMNTALNRRLTFKIAGSTGCPGPPERRWSSSSWRWSSPAAASASCTGSIRTPPWPTSS